MSADRKDISHGAIEGPNVEFARRHIGPDQGQIDEMLAALGLDSLEQLIDKTVPADIRFDQKLGIGAGRSEGALLTLLEQIAGQNQVWRSFIGMGYYNCITPPVIRRNILENPGWYTQYTPYQAEIAQGRLEALLNFQTMVMDLTAMDLANASLLDEATAAAEAMGMMWALQRKGQANRFFVASTCHPQTIAVLRTRAQARGIEIVVGEHHSVSLDDSFFGALVQYPDTFGKIWDYADFCHQVHQAGALVAVAADLLSLALLRPPGEFGADVVVGSTQRLGMPMGFGGPHAAYFATREQYKRQVPGRIIGVSQDRSGKPALRMALQTREQHIRRERATSNICTAQVLPAIVASMYAVYHGPEGLKRIAQYVQAQTRQLAAGCRQLGLKLGESPCFDTIDLTLDETQAAQIRQRAEKQQINFAWRSPTRLTISLDEGVDRSAVEEILAVLGGDAYSADMEPPVAQPDLPEVHRRASPFLSHPVFSTYRSETEMLRYMHRLERKDLSLTTSMIPLGSCTMKLNATVEMEPITWRPFADLHPFAPVEQAAGYKIVVDELVDYLKKITGFSGVSLQPNAGSQGELAGLLVIGQYHRSRNEGHRNVCLIPASAHGTNPASAVMAGLEVEVVKCDQQGNIDVADLETKARERAQDLAALMVTYPSTHGVFEADIAHICAIVHRYGGQVYMDGANMNAMVGVCRPQHFGIDVCHLNLHKTFCIPHGGGGPGMGPIAVAEHLVDYLPIHPLAMAEGAKAVGPVAAAPLSSALILLISWAYLKLMGDEGLRRATQVAILNANYIAQRLDPYFPVLYRGAEGFVAHETIVDLRAIKGATGVEADDVGKRLMDYGFHAPTVHFPVPGTLMIEPTESESKAELDRFCEAMIAICAEIKEIEAGDADRQDNLLKNAPHTLAMTLAEDWPFPYSVNRAVAPVPWVLEHKFWPAVARVDNSTGDRNLICACPPVDSYT